MRIGAEVLRILGTAATALALSGALAASAAWSQDAPRYAMLVRVLGNTVFELGRIGAEEAAGELSVELIYVGPTEGTAEAQIQLVDSLIAQRGDAIMVTADDATALTPSLRRAMRRGVRVVAWDQDLDPEGRELYVGASTNDLIALGPVKLASELTGGEGEVAIISGAANSTTQNIWVEEMRRLTEEDERFWGLEVVEVAYGDEKSDKAYDEALGLVAEHPDLEAIVAYTSIGIAAASQMVRDEGLVGEIQVTGPGFPNEMVEHVLSGATPGFSIWNMIDLGYAATHATHALVQGGIEGAPGESFEAGRLGPLEIGEGATTTLDELTIYDASNIEEAAALIDSLSQ